VVLPPEAGEILNCAGQIHLQHAVSADSRLIDRKDLAHNFVQRTRFLALPRNRPFPRKAKSCMVAAVARFSFDLSMKAITSPAMTTPRVALHTRRSAIGATLDCDGALGSIVEKRNAA